MNDQPDIFSRLITGPVLVVAGIAIYAGLLALQFIPPRDFYHAVGVVLGAQAYATVAGLFVLLGLQYMLGPRNWISRWLADSQRRLVLVSIIISAVIVAAFILAIW